MPNYDLGWFKGLDLPVPSTVSADETARVELANGLKALSKSLDYEFVVGGGGDAFSLMYENGKMIIKGGKTGVLYGAYRLLLMLKSGAAAESISLSESPDYPYRTLNHWDNMDGVVERGYAGRSLFFENGEFAFDPERMHHYARLLASVGINASCVVNVNVRGNATLLVTERFLPKVAELAAIFRKFGIRLFLSVNYTSPMEIGGLPTADPLDPAVGKWWTDQLKLVYEYVPDLLGVLVKADSEGRPGPFTYGRNHAEGANMLARAIKPFGGLVIWRCFVYNSQQNWRDKSTDRPKFPYESYHYLDDEFDENVILQVKYGPYDFQVREAVSPLLGAMEKTQEGLEFQLAQEYTGHQIDLFFMPPLWREIFDFDTKIGKNSIIREMSGNKIKLIAAVTNLGRDFNWTGHYLAQANLYAYGRMAWTTSLPSSDVAKEWLALEFESEKAREVILDMLLRSREIYENYTAPLGLCWMVTPHLHYGPSPEGYEFSLWGTYHRADRNGVGIDRTPAGTGYTSQYAPENAKMYEDKNTCPEALLLFFHRLSYDYKMKDGRTLIQYIYDTRFEGAAGAEKLLEDWKSLEGEVSKEIFEHSLDRFKKQLLNAYEWRDIMNTYFHRKSGIADACGRKIYD